jgi:indolepyruvate ferredoxin oxidoreductase, alpha subunit
MQQLDRTLLSGNEAIALAALDAGVALSTGYPGTPSTEILEALAALNGAGRCQWAPNEKVALEVALGAAYGGAAAMATMKHVGVNVAADPLFTAAYTGVSGALVLISADDPGMASSQNEQDNRRFALAVGVPMLEPADSQEAYDFFRQAILLSHGWQIPFLFRVTTRVCHSKSIVQRGSPTVPLVATFQRDIKGRVMIPAYARIAHKRLREKLAKLQHWNETAPFNQRITPASAPVASASSQMTPPTGKPPLGIISSGVAHLHAREAAPDAHHLKLAMTYPLPLNLIRNFATSVQRCVVIEEGDPYLVEALRANGILVEGKDESFRFGELNVERVRQILAHDTAPEQPIPPGKAPELCPGCPYHIVFSTLNKLDCIVAGDIGCYTLGVLPPYQAMDTCVCMGASLGVGLGLRHVLPVEQARRVVSVIGDSTFVHSGISGLVEMVYNPPATGHVLLILDNGTTAMTGQQEHPGTGRTIIHDPTHKLCIEDLARTMGIKNVDVLDVSKDPAAFESLLRQRLASNDLSVIIARKPCLLAAAKIREYERRGIGVPADGSCPAPSASSPMDPASQHTCPACTCSATPAAP